MATWNAIQSIEKLNEENYESWKLQMRSLLICNDLWTYVNSEEVKIEANQTEWTRKDQKALATIMLSVTRGQLNHIKRAETSRTAWTELERVYESKGPVRKATLYKQLYRMKKDPEISMATYINDFTCKADQLAEAGINIPEDLRSIMLLGSLPEEFENFTVAIESRDEIPSINNLKTKLLEEEARQTERDGRFENKSNIGGEAFYTKTTKPVNPRVIKNKCVPKNQTKFSGKCYECGKTGHRGADCYIRKKRESKKSDEAMTAIACEIVVQKSNIWCLDSAATKHMSNEKQKFCALEENIVSNVYTASDQWIKSYGAGECVIEVRLDNSITNKVRLKNVLFVPELKHNLISVPQITKNGFKVIFDKGHAVIKRKDGTTAMVAAKKNDLYIVDVVENRALLTGANLKKCARWHKRLGHVNFADLKRLYANDMVKGMSLDVRSENPESIGLHCLETRRNGSVRAMHVKELQTFPHGTKCPRLGSKSVKYLMFGVLTSWVHFLPAEGTSTYLWQLITCPSGPRRKLYPLMTPE